jgi:2-oxoglutarate ferredoxin oxidoreductase subunit delta
MKGEGRIVMAGKIVINSERCKGCGLCITVCPKDNIEIAKQSNASGYFPAVAKNTACSGCAKCAIICPEGIIEVCWEQIEQIQIVAKGRPQKVPGLVEEKA